MVKDNEILSHSQVHASSPAPMEGLLNVAMDARNSQWVESFCRILVESPVQLLADQAQYGPDGFPYLMVRTGGAEPMGKILPWLASKGIGLVVNPDKGTPDFVFPYGMIWHFREQGYFFRYHEAEAEPSSTRHFAGAQTIRYGQPSAAYLPLYVRNILKQFLLDQGILNPHILMVSWDQGCTYDLAFSAESVGTSTTEDQQALAEALAWFLPPHYGIAVLSEQGLPPFSPL